MTVTKDASVVLFDIPGKGTGDDKSWSLNILRIRYVLNYKNIPHTTRWVHYPDIKPLFLKLGIPSSGKNFLGEDAYTCPSIEFKPGDGTPSVYVTDSFAIAKFLDENYPNPPLFPKGNKEEQGELAFKARSELYLPVSDVLTPASYHYLCDESKPYFRQTRERTFGKKLEAMCPDQGTLAANHRISRERFDSFLQLFPEFGTFVYGEEINYLDFAIASIVRWIQVVANEELYCMVEEFNGGKWAKLLAAVEEKGLGKVH